MRTALRSDLIKVAQLFNSKGLHFEANKTIEQLGIDTSRQFIMVKGYGKNYPDCKAGDIYEFIENKLTDTPKFKNLRTGKIGVEFLYRLYYAPLVWGTGREKKVLLNYSGIKSEKTAGEVLLIDRGWSRDFNIPDDYEAINNNLYYYANLSNTIETIIDDIPQNDTIAIPQDIDNLNTNNKEQMINTTTNEFTRIQTEQFFSDKKNVKSIEGLTEKIEKQLEILGEAKNKIQSMYSTLERIQNNFNDSLNRNDYKSLEKQLAEIKLQTEFVDNFLGNTVGSLIEEKEPVNPLDIFNK